MMTKTRTLLREKLTYEVAQGKERNILHELSYPKRQAEFFALLESKQRLIQAIVAQHLGLQSSTACQVAPSQDWLHGSYNVCIPVTICERRRLKQHLKKRVLIRFPLPYRIGEDFRPGNGDEKIRCEAGTYSWIQEHCPDIPIPRLYGFGLSSGDTVCTPHALRSTHSPLTI